MGKISTKKIRKGSEFARAAVFLLLLLIAVPSWAIPLLHNSDNLPNASSPKWGGSWGVTGGKYGAFTCETCHNQTTTNIKRVITSIPDNIGPASTGGKPVYFMNVTGFGNDAGGHTTSTHICEVCHTITTVHNYNTAGQTDLNHQGANNTDCTACHSHSNAFAASCTACHGDDVASGKPITTGKHTAHLNPGVNVSLGTALGCAECHRKTVSANNNISTPANHMNGFTDYSGVRAGGSATLNVATGVCTNAYCHSDGKGRWNAPITTANGWLSTATIPDCKGCHGNDTQVGSTVSSYGEPNYSNAGSGAPRANSHRTTNNKHVTAAGDCTYCHSATTSTGVAILTGSTTHVDGTATVVSGGGKSFTYTTGSKTCSNISCHGGSSAVWGAVLGCTGCHGGDANSSAPMATGKHAKHTNNVGFLGTNYGCVECHAKTVSNNTTISNAARHQNGFTDYSGVKAGTYSSTTGNCTTAYCHSDGKGANTAFTTATGWRSAATLTCIGCHGADANAGSFASVAGEPNYSNAGSGAARANSHQKHVKTVGASTCGNCHSATTTTGTSIIANHTNATIDLAQGNGKTFTWTAGTKSCSNISCHFNATAQWGATLGCTGCHGDNVASGNPMSTGKHAKHINNAGFLGTNLGCVECHAKTVSNDTTISTAANHGNGFTDYSGVKAGTYSSATGNCATAYCHSDGKGRQNVAFTTANGWRSTATLDCRGCHGNDSQAGSFTSAYGEPNYSNTGSGVPRSNSHQTHVSSVGAATACANCHATTSTTGTSITGTNHLNQTINPVAGNGRTFTWAAGTKTCTTSNCHGQGAPVWGATLWSTTTQCEKCHGSANMANFYSTSYPTKVTAATDTKVGAHAFHLYSTTNKYTAPIICSACHTTPTPVTILAAPHLNGVNNVDFPTGSAARFNSVFPQYSSATGRCSTTYCHGSKMPDGSNNGSNTRPVWNNTAYLTGTPSITECGTCHGFPPNSGGHSGVASALNVCNGCHTHVNTDGTFNDKTKHINGIVDGGGCNGCHDYDTVGATYAGGVWTGGAWGVGKTALDGLNPGQGWGAHAKHINFIKTRLAIGAAGLTPTGQVFGTGEPANICGTCHTNITTNHTTGGSTTGRLINFGDGTFKMGGSTGTTIKFDPLTGTGHDPFYTGASGTSSATQAKTCQNISCHYFTTPLWSTY
jgi:predicted CxxxxCH...CXXCH cytochrome family protein